MYLYIHTYTQLYKMNKRLRNVFEDMNKGFHNLGKTNYFKSTRKQVYKDLN